IEEYTEEIRRSYEQRLETIWNRPVNRVHVLDFEGLTAEMRQDLAVRLRMAPEKVTGVDLFYLHNIDHRITNVPHLLAQYLFRHAEGRKSEARLSGGHFIRRLAMHFGLVSDEGLRGLQGPERQQAAMAGALEADKAGQAAEEVALEISTPVPAQAPPHLHPPHNHLIEASGQTYQPFDSTLVGSSGLSFLRRVRPRTSDASTSAAPHTNAQPDP
ncbi:hypothetical protein Tco_1460815, partial [Tanacetum coccineum]